MKSVMYDKGSMDRADRAKKRCNGGILLGHTLSLAQFNSKRFPLGQGYWSVFYKRTASTMKVVCTSGHNVHVCKCVRVLHKRRIHKQCLTVIQST